jgi:hypothetical protein
MNYADYLILRTREFLLENDKEIIASVEKRSPDLLERIENFRREKMTPDEQATNTLENILSTIKNNSIIRAHFRKDPTRQSIHEITQIEWIRRHRYPDVVKLPAARGGTYFCKNATTSAFPRPTDATKTLDIHSPSAIMYGVLKYSTTEGGAQDNQFRDVKHFIQQMVGYFGVNPTAKEVFDFYLDGPYYTEKKRTELIGMIPEPLRTKIRITSVATIIPRQ